MSQPLTRVVTVHGYFERIEQRIQSQNTHFQLNELWYTQGGVSIFSQLKRQICPIIILLANIRTKFDFQNRTI
ncbi:MAG: hypothetical protein J7M40_20405, partial [Planctomycetes bacterium]|nr:hypothetical protein [Planctomycetota bacterium]